jgi:hypothetical protein
MYHYLNASGQIGSNFADGTSTFSTITGPVAQLNTWYHLTTVIFNGTMTYYVNGVVIGSAIYTQIPAVTVQYSTSIGARTTGTLPCIGANIDDLRIFDRALTAAQVQSIYNQQGVPGRGVQNSRVPTFTVSDQSQKPLTLSTYGSATSNTNSPFGGTEGSIENLNYGIPSSVSKTNFSFWSSNCFIEFWMYLSGTNSGNPRIIERGNYPNSEYSVYMNASSGGYRLKFSYGSNFPFSFQFVPGTWNHFSFSYNYATQTLYGSINGSVASGGTTSGITYNSGSSVSLYPSGGGYVIDISNLRVVTGAATLPYISNFTPPTAPLSIYPTGTTALLLRSVSPLTMFSGGAIQSATGGNTVQDIGGYRIHTFTTIGTSTFTPSTSGNVEVLVVAGGGGGGDDSGGGGGGGQLSYNTQLAITGSVNVTVGSGGARNGYRQTGSTGGSSSFGTITATGGYGGIGNIGIGGASASGFSGGTAGTTGGGGGGGATTSGSNGVGTVGGSGGTGILNSISGTSTYYGGGGGGGAWNGTGGSGGTGGGGLGGSAQAVLATNGTPNTGGGGGGSGWSGYGSGSGGSGIVIVRYPLPVRMTGTPLFTQLSPSAVASSVGAFSLRAVNGTSARAVQVRPQAQFPPVAMTSAAVQAGNQFTQTLAGYSFGGTGSYVSNSSSTLSSNYSWRAFDGIDSLGRWVSAATYTVNTPYSGTATTTAAGFSYPGEWLQIQLPQAIVLSSYSIFPQNTNIPSIWNVFASNDGTTWTVIDQRGTPPSTGIYNNYTISGSPVAYSHYRMGCYQVSLNNSFAIGEMKLYGSNASWQTDFYTDRLGNLLTAPVVGQSLANWLGGATGYVTTWYDQSGAGNHATQLTAANQPIIQRATKGPGYSCLFNGTTNSLNTSTGGILDNTNYTFIGITRRNAAKKNSYFFGINGPGALNSRLHVGYQYSFALGDGADSFKLDQYANAVGYNPANFTTASAEALRYTTGMQSSTSGKKLYTSDTANYGITASSVNTNPLTSGGGFMYIGQAPGQGFYQGEIYELLVFTQSLYDLDTSGGLINQVYQNQLGAYGT